MSTFSTPFITNIAKTYECMCENDVAKHLQLDYGRQVIKGIEGVKRVNTAADYKVATVLRRLCDDIWFAEDILAKAPMLELAGKISGSIFKEMTRYNNRFLIKDPKKLVIARYLLWNYSFTGVPKKNAFLLARHYGLLRRGTNPDYPCIYVVGLKRKVGDNVFTVDSRGRHHRQYNETLGLQAFAVLKSTGMNNAEHEAFLATLPELDNTFHETSVGDGKHAARGSAFGKAAKKLCHDELNATLIASLEAGLKVDVEDKTHSRSVIHVEQLQLLAV